MASQQTRADRVSSRIRVMRAALADVLAERDAIIKEGGGTPAGALNWLNAADPPLVNASAAEIAAALVVMADLDTWRQTDDRDEDLVKAEI